MKQAEVVQQKAREWIPLLDAIRGLAVLGVVMTHAYGASWISDRYDQAGFSGFAKVVGTAVLWIPILFWLSGFVIMMVMQPYFDTKRNLWSFFPASDDPNHANMVVWHCFFNLRFNRHRCTS